MADSLPMPALLSGALVAFTIELDNQAACGFVHRTAWQKGLRQSSGGRGLSRP